MSALTEALDRILGWLQKHKPECVSLLRPGLENSEIEDRVKDLSIPLPPEVYELYKWRNGSGDDPMSKNSIQIFPEGFGFWSLSTAIKIHSQKIKFNNLQKYQQVISNFSANYLELFYCYTGEYSGFVIINKEQTYPVIFNHSRGDETRQHYDSLTSMMLTVAEGYETGVYSVTKHKHSTVPVINDYRKAHQIWRKYNPEITALLYLLS